MRRPQPSKQVHLLSLVKRVHKARNRDQVLGSTPIPTHLRRLHDGAPLLAGQLRVVLAQDAKYAVCTHKNIKRCRKGIAPAQYNLAALLTAGSEEQLIRSSQSDMRHLLSRQCPTAKRAQQLGWHSLARHIQQLLIRLLAGSTVPGETHTGDTGRASARPSSHPAAACSRSSSLCGPRAACEHAESLTATPKPSGHSA